MYTQQVQAQPQRGEGVAGRSTITRVLITAENSILRGELRVYVSVSGSSLGLCLRVCLSLSVCGSPPCLSLWL